MSTLNVIGIGLIIVPVIAWWFVALQLAPYRRDGRGVPGMILQWQVRSLRPDLYTDDGQHLVRCLWALAILTVPWILAVTFIFLR
jgi:hypothetical protein